MNGKRVALFFALLFCLSTIGSLSVWASPETPIIPINPQSDYFYSLVNGKAIITGYTGTSSSLVIPEVLAGCPVTEIGPGAFQNVEGFSEITLPATIKTIGAGAFSGCTGLVRATYSGTAQQWKAVTVGENNELLLTALASSFIVWGDANDDGKVTVADVLRLKSYFANMDYETGKSTETIGPGADANGDENVTAADVVRLKNYFANMDYEIGKSTERLGPEA